MNNAERRLQEVEERLKNFEAPEPPASLLESIQVEIPEDLGGQTHAPDAPAHRRFLKLAASLAVVAVGGVLGYRLLEEGPAPGDVVTPEVPIAELEPLRTPGKAEIEGLSTIGSLDLELGETKSASGGPIPSPAREDSITVTSESPLVDEVKLSSGRSVGRTEVEEIPSTPAGSAEPASGVRNELGEVFPSRGEADEDAARRRKELLSRLHELEQRKRDGRDSAAPALPKPKAKRVPIPDLSEAVLLAPPAVADEVSVLEDASHLGYNRQVV
ncbi:MAG: hypothetical protein O7A98_10570, partial [Acidobacteria bacterium]|nr:hypothetical protein [Acidobacteriota bacterium]